MIEVLKQVLLSPVGSFGFVFGFVVLVGWFVFWLHGKFVTMLANHKALADKCDTTKNGCDSACDRLDKRIESLRDDVHGIKGDLQYIKSMINVQVNTPVRGQDSMVQAHSPLSLTDVGKQAVIDMKAEEALAVNWEKIKAIMDVEITNKNPYDIQTYCLEKITIAPERFFDTARIEAFKIYAFQHGRTLFECMKVIGILVRDKYFEVLGIPLAALDGPSQSK